MDDTTVLVLADPAEPELAMLEKLPGASIAVGNTLAALAPAAPRAGAILHSSASVEVFEQVWNIAPRVRWVHSLSAGLDGVLFPALIDSPVVVTNARGAYSDMLGEFAIGAILFFARDFRRLVRNQMAQVWEEFDSIRVQNQTAGIVGYGDLGRAVASRARALGMKVLALRRRPELSRGDPYADRIFGPAEICEMIAQCDYVIASAPITPETRGLIGPAQIAAMKPSAVFINIGRGPVADEPALIHALETGRIRGAALDVFDTEPLPAGHPFYKLDNVLLSPHCADHALGWRERSMNVFLENFESFRRGEPLANPVDKKAGY